MPTEEQYWQAIQRHVCSRCDDGDGTGGCTLNGGSRCSLRTYFPEILQVVNSMYSHSLAPYEELLRNRVCGLCFHQSSSGECTLRTEGTCALDHFLPLVVQVIEETQVHHGI